MSSRRVAHVIFPRPGSIRPVLDFPLDAARALLDAGGLDVEVLVPIPHPLARSLQSSLRRERGASPWPADLDLRLSTLSPRPTLVPYLPVPARSIESAAAALALHLALRRPADRPALVHGSFLDQGGYAAVAAARVLGVPSIAVAHGTDVRAAKGELGDEGGRRRRARMTLRHATRVLAVSTYLASELALLGRHADLVRYTTLAARFPLRPPSRAGGEPEELLFVGHQSRAKGVDLLLEAFASLRDRTLVLRLVGPSSPDLDPRREAERLGIAERVCVEGEVPQEELVSRYARASCVVLPSRREGFGIVLAEALLVGRPVVGADVGGIREVATGAVGALFAPGDPEDLARALEEVLARARRGDLDPAALRRSVLPMTWEQSGPELASLTRSLIRAA